MAVTKDSPAIVYETIKCERCGRGSDIGFLSFRDIDGMDYLWEDGGPAMPEDRREYIYVCYDCDWKLMNGWPMEYSDEESDEDDDSSKEWG